MINNIIKFIKENWQMIGIIIIIICYFNNQELFDGNAEGELIRAGCKYKSPLQDYINTLDSRDPENRTTLEPIVDLNMNYANIGSDI